MHNKIQREDGSDDTSLHVMQKPQCEQRSAGCRRRLRGAPRQRPIASREPEQSGPGVRQRVTQPLVDQAKPLPFRSFFRVSAVELAVGCWLGPLRRERGDDQQAGGRKRDDEGRRCNVCALVFQHCKLHVKNGRLNFQRDEKNGHPAAAAAAAAALLQSSAAGAVGCGGGVGGVDELGFRSPPPDDCSEFRTVWVFLLARWATPPSGVAASVFTATSSGHHPLAAAASNSWAQK